MLTGRESGCTMQTVYGSHSAIRPFRLLRPTNPLDAVRAYADAGHDAVFLAGGVDLVPAIRSGRRAGTVVWLGDMPALQEITSREDGLSIGAGVTYAKLAESGDVAHLLPGLARAWSVVANVRVRHVATVGGNIMACNSYYDMLPALLALDARLQFIGRDGAVTVTEGYRPNLPNGLLCSIDIPYVEERRFLIDRSYKPIVSVAVSVNRKDGILVGRAALGCAHSWPFSAALNTGPAMDWADLAIRAESIASAFGAALAEPISDAVASSSYRRDLARILLKRALIAIARDGDSA